MNQIWKPPANLSISQWADTYRRLSPESSAEAGAWRTSRVPFQAEIMDTFNDPKIEQVVFCKSAQVGATEILLNIIGYYIDQDPAPLLIMQPTLQMAQAFSKDRLATMLRDSPKIKNAVGDPKSKNSENTVLHKKFKGGHLTITGSNSAAGLASRPVRILLADEVSRYEASAGIEGDPVNLAMKRTTTFWNRKIYLCSTPTVENICRITSAFEEGDQRYFHVPCPECNEYQQLKWKGVVWEDNKPETAVYSCEHCGSVIEERKKQGMLAKGKWIPTKPTKKIASFHISEIYSPFRTWAEMAESFLEAKKTPETLKTFVNTSLGEVFRDEGEELDADNLLSRRENYDENNIPDQVLVLTAGADIQQDRIEVQVVGYGRQNECWIILHRIFWGDPSISQVWNDVDDFLKTRFKTQSGVVLPISAAGIDSGGHHTSQCYAFTKPRQGRRIFAVKGTNQAGKPIAGRVSYVGKNRTALINVGTDTAKELIFARLKDTKSSLIHFPSNVDDEFFLQLTAEKKIVKYFKGMKRNEWKQIRERNEALDCLVYAWAALHILNPNYDAIEARMLDKPLVDDQPQQNPIRRPRNRINRNPQNYINSWRD